MRQDLLLYLHSWNTFFFQKLVFMSMAEMSKGIRHWFTSPFRPKKKMSLRLLPRRRQARWILSWALDSHHIILLATRRPWLKHSSNLTKVAQMHTSLEAASLEGLKPWSSSFLRSFQCAFCDFRKLKLEFCQSPAITCCSFLRGFHPTAQNNNPTNSPKKQAPFCFWIPGPLNNAVANLLSDVSWGLGSLAKLFNGKVNGAEVSLGSAASSAAGAASAAAGGAALGAGSGRRRAAAVPWVMAATASNQSLGGWFFADFEKIEFQHLMQI